MADHKSVGKKMKDSIKTVKDKITCHSHEKDYCNHDSRDINDELLEQQIDASADQNPEMSNPTEPWLIIDGENTRLGYSKESIYEPIQLGTVSQEPETLGRQLDETDVIGLPTDETSIHHNDVLYKGVQLRNTL